MSMNSVPQLVNSDSNIRHRKLTHSSSGGQWQSSTHNRQNSHSPPRRRTPPSRQSSHQASRPTLNRQSSQSSQHSHSPSSQQTSPIPETQSSTSISRTLKQMYSNSSSMTFSDFGDDDEDDEEGEDRNDKDKFNGEPLPAMANKSLSFEDQTFTPHGATGSARLRNLGRMNSRLLADQVRRGQTVSMPPDSDPGSTSPSTSTSPEKKGFDGNVNPRKENLYKQRSSRMSMNMSNRIAVGVKMKVKLDYIDDVNQEIHTEVFLSMHYRCWKAEEFVSGQNGFVALSPEEYPDIYVPMVEFLNFRNCEHIEGFRLLVNTLSGEVYIYRVYRVVFRGLLKLDRFPFDRQIINVELKSFTAKLVPWSMPESDVPYGIRADELWCNHDVVVECDGSLWELNWTRGMVHREANPSMYIASFGIERISLFYVTNFFLVTFFVVGSVFGCQAIPYKDFGTRSSITFTILLTIISLKFIMASYTPKINYLTWLDYYNLLAMLFLIVVILENYVVSTVSSMSFLIVYPIGLQYYTVSSEAIDATVPAGLILFWVLFHVLILCGWMWEWFYESWEQVLCKESRTDVARISGDVAIM